MGLPPILPGTTLVTGTDRFDQDCGFSGVRSGSDLTPEKNKIEYHFLEYVVVYQRNCPQFPEDSKY